MFKMELSSHFLFFLTRKVSLLPLLKKSKYNRHICCYIKKKSTFAKIRNAPTNALDFLNDIASTE